MVVATVVVVSELGALEELLEALVELLEAMERLLDRDDVCVVVVEVANGEANTSVNKCHGFRRKTY